jgi:tRNA (adenine57-N1/adenine58-N1)-methyltransferase
VPGLGVVDTAKLAGQVGRVAKIAGRPFLVLRPGTEDLMDALERKAQIITAKDAGPLLLLAGVKAGDVVLEAGAGSGALTTLLARAVTPGGRVHSVEIREDFLAVARRNVERAGFAPAVTFHHGDVREGIEPRDLDAVILDIPEPWAAVAPAWDALRPCGTLATFSPNMEQVRATHEAISEHPFIDVRTIEVIERDLEVHEGGVRPAFAALGHTGYLTFARKVLERF